MGWWTIADSLKISIMDVLLTHTEGQLRLIALASQVQYENMKRDTKAKTNKSVGDDSPPLYNNSDGDDDDRPSKPVSKMTKRELEEYYRSREF